VQISNDDYLKLRGLLALADDHRQAMEQIEGSVKRLLQTESDIVSDEVWGFHHGANDLLRKLDIAVLPDPMAQLHRRIDGPAVCADCDEPILFNGIKWIHAYDTTHGHYANLKGAPPAAGFTTTQDVGAFCAQCGRHITLNGETWEHSGPTQPRHIATPMKEPTHRAAPFDGALVDSLTGATACAVCGQEIRTVNGFWFHKE
jgi:hypothetical protein